MSSMDIRLPIEHLRNANLRWIREDLGDLDALAKSMKRSGQLFPVIVDPTYRVLDGARRIEAATKLGWHEVYVICTSDFDTIADQLEAARQSAMPMTWLEIMELREILRALYAPISHQQAVQTKKAGLPARRQRDSGVAVALPRALGVTRNQAEELGRVWSMLHDTGRYTKEARDRMRVVVPEIEATGRLYSLIGAMKRAAYPPLPRASDKDVLKAQRASFPGVLLGLRGTILALPEPNDLDSGHRKEDLAEWDKGLTEIIQEIYQVRKEIRKQLKQDPEGDLKS